MTAYVIADIRLTGDASEMSRYRSGVADTLRPYGGRFLVRGGARETVEGAWAPERVVVIEFPDAQAARAWHASAAYQEILPLRTRNADSNVVIVDGVAAPG